MKPVEFKQMTHTLAKDQREYQPLPVCLLHDGEVVSCWRLSWWERLLILFSGRIWLRQLTFHMKLQPQLPQVTNPFLGGLPLCTTAIPKKYG